MLHERRTGKTCLIWDNSDNVIDDSLIFTREAGGCVTLEHI